jgi:Protein of unknown function (DUF3606)
MPLQPPLITRRECNAIDVEADWAVDYWARHFQVSGAELLRIVHEVGADSEAVAHFLVTRSAPVRAPRTEPLVSIEIPKGRRERR